MVPSPTGRAAPYNAMTAQRQNPMFGQIMQYQLGKQTNLSAEEINRNRDYMNLLRETINNAGGQGMRGAVAQGQIENAAFNKGSRMGQTGLGVNPSPVHARTHAANAMQQQALQNALSQTKGIGQGSPFGMTVDAQGAVVPTTPRQRVITTENIGAASRKGDTYNTKVTQTDKAKKSGYVDGEIVETESGTKTETKTRQSEQSPASQAVVANLPPEHQKIFNEGGGYLLDQGDGTFIFMIVNPDGSGNDVNAGLVDQYGNNIKSNIQQ
jgi:hypothetical protein